LSEYDPAAPDEPYGASKLAIELIGDTLSKRTPVQFLSLRIARVVGPGARQTSSPWRSQIFERSQHLNSIHIPFCPEATLSLVHVEDVARMLITLLDAPAARSSVYNTPVEIWTAQELKEAIEDLWSIRVELDAGGCHGGPVCEGSRFALEFGFHLRGIRDRLSKEPARL
jgi:nucleoside-diphosphate-sugar epimerase